MTTYLTKGTLVGTMALALLVSAASVVPAHAQTTTTTTVSCSVGTADLTVGSSGLAVTCLQQTLISWGFSIPAGATGYFGTQTRAAVAAWQASKNITPAAGYFGPISRGAWMSAGGGTSGGSTVPGCTPGAAYSSTTGQSCTQTSTVPGCQPGYVYSPTTGQRCSGGTTGGGTPSGGLQGGAGSIDQYTLLSSINNEEVGEDQEDVEVASLEIEVDEGSDIRLTAVRLVFDEGTAGSDFEDYASEVSLWLDGEEVGRVDADEFTDDNNWTKTVSLDSGAIIRRGDTGELTVAVSGAANLDSADEGDTWTVDFRQIRFVDADGATVSEDPSTAARTFSFEAFASAANVELKIQSNEAAINVARTIEVDATNDTDNVEVMSFTLEAEGDSDLDIKTFAVSVTVTGAANTDDVLAGLSLWIDGEEVASANTVSSGGTTETYVFEDVDYTIDAGDEVEAEIRADFISIADNLDEGDTISFSISEDLTDQSSLFDIEDETGEELADADITGSVTSGAFELRSVGIMVTFVDATETIQVSNGADNDSGTFRIRYNVQAFGGTVYVSDSAVATTDVGEDGIEETTLPSDPGVIYVVEKDGSATVDDLSDLVTFRRVSGSPTDAGVTNGVELNEGEVAEFTLTVTRTNNGDASDNGIFRVLLDAIGWATSDTSTMNVYDFNLEDFKTDPVTLD